MNQPKGQSESKPKCEGCGSDQVMLTEELNAPKRCGGCGKPVGK